MYIVKAISYLGGWELLRRDKPTELGDLHDAIAFLIEKNLRDPDIVSRFRRESTNVSPMRISGSNFVRAFDYFLRMRSWDQDHRVVSRNQRGMRAFVPNLNNGVGASLVTLNRGTFPNWLLAEVPWLSAQEVCTVSVLVVLLENSKRLIEDVRGAILTYEVCRAQIADLLPLRPTSPFVILGISPKDAPMEVEELEAVPRDTFGSESILEKCIEFAPEHYQAGVAILSYFGEVLKQKHPDLKAKVRIEQDGLKVRMHIESATGDRETIEQTLQEYGLVIAQQAPPEVLFSGPLQIAALEHKLELAQMEIRHTQQLLALTESSYAARVTRLHDEVTYLRRYMGAQLRQVDATHLLLSQQVQSGERMLLSQMEHSRVLVTTLIEEVKISPDAVAALRFIHQKLGDGVTLADERDIKKALAAVLAEAPGLFSRLGEALRNVAYGVGGNYVFQWLQALGSMLP